MSEWRPVFDRNTVRSIPGIRIYTALSGKAKEPDSQSPEVETALPLPLPVIPDDTLTSTDLDGG